MKNGKCRMHGGASTGPKTKEGRARIAAARTIHGAYGAAMRAVQARVTAIAARGRVLRELVKTALPMEALGPILRTVQPPHEKRRDGTRYAVSPMAVLTLPLTASQGRDLVRLIREAMAPPVPPGQQPSRIIHGGTPCAVRPRGKSQRPDGRAMPP